MTPKGLAQNGETYQYDLWLNEKLPRNVGIYLSWPTQWTKKYMIKIPKSLTSFKELQVSHY
jgi:hypothetical protein